MASHRAKQTPLSLAETFTELRADYDLNHRTRYERQRIGLASGGAGADFHFRNEGWYLQGIELARDHDRNSDIIGQAITRAVNNIVQTGIMLDVDTGDSELDRDLSARWQAWSEDPMQCDLAGERSFAAIAATTLRAHFVDGDHIVLGNKSGALELVEAHRCRTPRNTKRSVVYGVLLDAARRRKEYWLTKEDVDPRARVDRVADIKVYPVYASHPVLDTAVRQVFHVYNPKRSSQTRGVTALAPILATAGMFSDLSYANLVRAQIASCYAILRERDVGFEGTGEDFESPISEGFDPEDIAPGMEWVGAVGEKLKGFSPNVPNPEFFPHSKLLLTIIGINIGLPYCLMIMDAGETNFSGWRGAVDQAKHGWRENQRCLISRLHRPVYLWKLAQWISEDGALRRAALRGDVKIGGHKWVPPSWKSIQPLQDATANQVRLVSRQASPRAILAEDGRDFQATVNEIVADNLYGIRTAMQASEELATEFPNQSPVDWRLFWSPVTPEGVTVNIDTGNAGTEGKKNGKDD